MSSLRFSDIPSYWAKLRAEVVNLQFHNIIPRPRDEYDPSDVSITLANLDDLFSDLEACDVKKEYPDIILRILDTEFPRLLEALSAAPLPARIDNFTTKFTGHLAHVGNSPHAEVLQQLVFALNFAESAFSNENLGQTDVANIIGDLGVSIGLAAFTANAIPEIQEDFSELVDLHKVLECFVNARNLCCALQAKLWLHAGGILYTICRTALAE